VDIGKAIVKHAMVAKHPLATTATTTTPGKHEEHDHRGGGGKASAKHATVAKHPPATTTIIMTTKMLPE
jgi:hypothetical protein